MNRLAREKSPYLLQHADNPVDWMPWGEEAFTRARAENKPIFLSIGYSTCHWCHVMAHESFENEKIAEILNRHFVSIKVDREERPDVDRVYMTFVQATTGSGGWPMSVWLTPDLKPFHGGTYFPPTDRYGRPGFTTVLLKIAELWENRREKLEEQSREMTDRLRTLEQTASGEAPPSFQALHRAFDAFDAGFDEEWGGFGHAPKFPRPSVLNFLFQYSARPDVAKEKRERARHLALRTLDRMAWGGMHDVLGGGFHRYSVDGYWHVPHFEKMLYDQGQLVSAYLDAFLITGNAQYASVVRDICNYVLRDLTGPEGGFYSAEDADSFLEEGKPEHGEGAFYIWSEKELDELLGSSAELFKHHYNTEPGGNAPSGSDPHGEFTGKNIFIQTKSLAQTAMALGLTLEMAEKKLEEGHAILFQARNKRPRPHLDDKIITSWNGLMIGAMARAGFILSEPRYVEAASKAARFILDHVRFNDGSLRRNYRQGPSEIAGFADDYAFFIQGLIALYETTFQVEWLEHALQLQKIMNDLFWDELNGGYFSAPANDPNILLRMKEDYDGAEPSPNSVAALNLLRLADLLKKEEPSERASRILRVFSTQIERMPHAVPCLLCALDRWHESSQQIVIAGKGPEVDKLLNPLRRNYLPRASVAVLSSDQDKEFFRKQNDWFSTLEGSVPTAYFCENFACQLPMKDPAGWEDKVKTVVV